MNNFSSAQKLSDIFSSPDLAIYFLIAVANAFLLLLISYKFLQIMQQSGYEGFGYFKWLRRRDNIYLSRLSTVSLLSVLGFLLSNVSLAIIESRWVFYVGFAFYVVFVIYYYRADKKLIRKVPIVSTARMRRLIAVYFLVLFTISFAVVILVNVLAFYLRFNPLLVKVRFAPLCITPIGVPFFVLLAYYITKPYETRVQKNYIKKCMTKLYARPDLIKIGITGSYGKTTVKEALKAMLEEKYCVLATPSSYNTPMGICKTVKNLEDRHEVFIAEMGARHVGDIKELAEIVKPGYAVVNGVVGQHLETFGTIDAIKKTKFELVENMTPNGVAAYTVDNGNTVELFRDCKMRCIPAGLDLSKNPSVYAKDIVLSSEGSSFMLCFGDKEEQCACALLGKHNVSNVCLAAAIAYEMGLSTGEISAGISRIKPVPHRLQLVETEKDITVIDDSYNSNTAGVRAALDVLSCFNGRKIVVTPGMVELGRDEDIENYKFGGELAAACDVAILVGRSATYRIQDGLIDRGFDTDNMFVVKDLDSARKKLNKIIRSGDVVLLENDLPDKFA